MEGRLCWTGGAPYPIPPGVPRRRGVIERAHHCGYHPLVDHHEDPFRSPGLRAVTSHARDASRTPSEVRWASTAACTAAKTRVLVAGSASRRRVWPIPLAVKNSTVSARHGPATAARR